MHRQNTVAWYAGATACAVLLALLAAAVATGAAAPFDSLVRDAIHRQASSGLTELARLFTFIGSSPVWVAATAIAAAILWLNGLRRRAWAIALAMSGAILLDNGLKAMFHRARPDTFFGDAPASYSFPSGHALFAACFYGALAAVLATGIRKPIWRAAICAGALCMILGIGLSRIYSACITRRMSWQAIWWAVRGWRCCARWASSDRRSGPPPSATRPSRIRYMLDYAIPVAIVIFYLVLYWNQALTA